MELAQTAPRRRWRWTAAAVTVPLAVVLLVALVSLREDDRGLVLRSNDLPTVTVPAIPEPVDTSTLQDGWYLILAPTVFTTEDELLLQAARELAIEARGAGYVDAKLIRSPATPGTCSAEGGCISGTPGMGYYVLLKGPYSVPTWGESDADLDAEFTWHQTTQATEVAEAVSRGLTLKPGVALLDF